MYNMWDPFLCGREMVGEMVARGHSVQGVQEKDQFWSIIEAFCVEIQASAAAT